MAEGSRPATPQLQAQDDVLSLSIPKEQFHSASYQGCEGFLLECQRKDIPLSKVVPA